MLAAEPVRGAAVPVLHPDLPENEFRTLGRQVIDLVAEYYAEIERAPAFPAREPASVAALFDRPVPEGAEDPAAILADWREKIVPNSSRQGSPRWFGFVNGSGTQIGALAEALASAVNPNVGGWRASPAATEIERQTIRWLAELIGYHADCGGLFLSGGTMANAAGLRTALCNKATWDLLADGLQDRGSEGRMTIYLADHETHVSLLRAVDLLGLGRASLRQVPSNADFTMDVAALDWMIAADLDAGMRPFCVVGNVGSINVGAIDDIAALADVAERRGLWLHLDGACGALGGLIQCRSTRTSGWACRTRPAASWCATPKRCVAPGRCTPPTSFPRRRTSTADSTTSSTVRSCHAAGARSRCG